jgi:hypothetical protein
MEEIETVEVVRRKLAPWWAVAALGIIGLGLMYIGLTGKK